MVDRVRNEYAPTEVTPPGETLREVLEERGISQAELAARMGRPKKTISEIVNGKAAITPETALQLELVLGIRASFWTVRESNFREYVARKEQELKLADARDWLRLFPLREMRRLGWIPECKDTVAQVKSVLEFFGVASPEQFSEVLESRRVAYRRSSAFESDERALAAWLRAGTVQAERIRCEPYDRVKFLEALAAARTLTVEAPEVFQPRLIDTCAEAGVAVAFVPELRGSRASGATRWLSPYKALVQLSLRYRTDDHLWFTFFHEAAHVLFHGRRLIYLEGDRHEGEEEEYADRWSADFLIPPDAYRELTSPKGYSKRALREFARELGIAPGIVVGRLQHDGLLPHSHCNDLKRRLAWSVG